MSISLVEAKHLGIGLKTLPHPIQEHVQKKAERTINKIEKEGYSEEEVVRPVARWGQVLERPVLVSVVIWGAWEVWEVIAG